MWGRGGSKVFFVSGAVILTVLLYLAPKKALRPAGPAKPVAAFSMADMLAFQEQNLTAEERQKTEDWKLRVNAPGGLPWYDSLASLWDQKKIYALSGYYFEQKATRDSAEKSYLNAAYRYFDAYKTAVDSSVRAAMVAGAIRNYRQVLEGNPGNENAKTDLGVLYAEATGEPMKGIRLLQEVVQANPEHENAQYNLGILSVRSGQYEKALDRFNRVLTINPQRTEAYLLRARVFMELGDRDRARADLGKFKSLTGDPDAAAEAERMIESLK